jgi:WD40 repeat protein
MMARFSSGPAVRQASILTGHSKGSELRFSPDGRQLVSTSLDDTLRCGTRKQPELFSPAQQVEVLIASVMWLLADGNLLISIDYLSSEETELKVWGRSIGPCSANFKSCDTSPSPDGGWVAARGAQLNDIQLWDLAKLSAAELANLDLHKVEPLVIPEAHKAVILNFAFSPDGMRMVSSSLDGTARVWSLSPDGVEPLMTLSGHDNIVYDVAFSPDGTRVATSSPDGTVRVWDITPAGTSELFAIEAHSRNILGFGLTADGKYLATASPDGSARVWDLDSGEKLIEISGDGTPLFGADISRDGKFLATAGFDNLAKIWKLDLSPGAASAELLHTLTGHAEGPPVGSVFPGLTSVVFSPDGSMLATGGVDKMAKVWDVQTGEELLSVPVEEDGSGVTNLAFSPDGCSWRLPATTPSGTTLAKIWDIESGEELTTLPGMEIPAHLGGLQPRRNAWRPAHGMVSRRFGILILARNCLTSWAIYRDLRIGI